jgi:hypothetical protein
MDARPGGPATKREPSPEGLGLNPEDDPPAPACRGSAVGAALNLRTLANLSLERKPTCPGVPWRDLQFSGPFVETLFLTLKGHRV